jgi:hypothetical protein
MHTLPPWVSLLHLGEPIICSIIFACKNLEPLMVQGLDPFASWEGHDVDLDSNTGPRKQNHQDPQCHFNGTTAPCFFTYSDSGSINGKY